MTTELFVENLLRSNHWLVFWVFTLGLKFKFGVKEESGEDLSPKMMWVNFQILKKKKILSFNFICSCYETFYRILKFWKLQSCLTDVSICLEIYQQKFFNKIVCLEAHDSCSKVSRLHILSERCISRHQMNLSLH